MSDGGQQQSSITKRPKHTIKLQTRYDFEDLGLFGLMVSG